MASVLGEVTVAPIPPCVVERIQVTVPPEPPLTVALKVTCPPAHMVVGVSVLVAHVGSATTVIAALCPEISVGQFGVLVCLTLVIA